jgi:serine/threonine protein kinase
MKIGLGSEAPSGASAGTAAGAKGKAFVPPAPAELAPMFPQLEVMGLIGQGGMGAVYKARQKELDRVVALKILPPDIGQDAAFAERFTREAKALARLDHPGIVTIHDFGRATGLYFFVMEYVDGVNLQQLLHGGRVSAREALAIVPQICDALQYAHDQGIVHRDIKPENILLDRQGRVKVADFGLAKLVGADALTPALSHAAGEGGSTALTEAGKVMGTPQYMAPEQREHPTEVDHRADIYSLGVVFYQMLTGELPVRPIEPPSRRVQVDVRLDEVVLRALEKEPQRRFQQVRQVKTAVETVAATASPQHARAPASPAPMRPHAVRAGVAVGIAVVLLICLALAAGRFVSIDSAKTAGTAQLPDADQLTPGGDDAARQVALLREENERLNRDAAELLKLRGEVTRLRTESRAAAQADIADEPHGALARAVQARVKKLRETLQQNPERQIPELQFLTLTNWFDVASRHELDSTEDLERALDSLENVAWQAFVRQMLRPAMSNYVRANNGQVPTEFSELKPYFSAPIDEAILSRYRMVQNGNVSNLDLEKPLIEQVAGHYGITASGAGAINDQ